MGIGNRTSRVFAYPSNGVENSNKAYYIWSAFSDSRTFINLCSPPPPFFPRVANFILSEQSDPVTVSGIKLKYVEKIVFIYAVDICQK